MKSLPAFLLSLLATTVVLAAPPEVLSIRGNRHINDYREAKRVLPKIFKGHEITLYCGCRYYGKDINLNSCGVGGLAGATKRLRKLEWEHVVPAAKFGETVRAWRSGDDLCRSGKLRGRKCAEKASPLFRQMEADLYNLWPENGEINGARSDKPPREQIHGQVRTFGTCATQIGRNAFNPRPEARGPVARSYLYMSWAYEISLQKDERLLFEKWNKAHPPSDFECERGRKIKDVQGNSNPILEEACQKKRPF